MKLAETTSHTAAHDAIATTVPETQSTPAPLAPAFIPQVPQVSPEPMESRTPTVIPSVSASEVELAERQALLSTRGKVDIVPEEAPAPQTTASYALRTVEELPENTWHAIPESEAADVEHEDEVGQDALPLSPREEHEDTLEDLNADALENAAEEGPSPKGRPRRGPRRRHRSKNYRPKGTSQAEGGAEEGQKSEIIPDA